MTAIIVTYNLILKLFLLICVFYYGYVNSKRFRISKLNFFALFFLHFTLSFFSCYLSQGSINDASTYYKIASESGGWFSLFGLGAKSIPFLIYPFVKLLKFDFQLIFFVFSSFSFFGFLYLNKILRELEFPKKKLLLGISVINIILFLPSFHFWTATLGKDCLVFFSQVLILNYSCNWRNNKKKILFLLLLIGLIRSYLIAIFIFSIVIYYISKAFKKPKNFIVFLLLILAVTIASLIVTYYFNFHVFEYIQQRSQYISHYALKRMAKDASSSFIDTSSLSILERMFMYLFGPTPFNAKSTFQIYISLENVLLFIIILRGLIAFSYRRISSSVIASICFYYSLVLLIIQSYMLYNLGLANRQKFMVLPFVFYIILFLFNKKVIVIDHKYE